MKGNRLSDVLHHRSHKCPLLCNKTKGKSSKLCAFGKGNGIDTNQVAWLPSSALYITEYSVLYKSLKGKRNVITLISN